VGLKSTTATMGAQTPSHARVPLLQAPKNTLPIPRRSITYYLKKDTPMLTSPDAALNSDSDDKARIKELEEILRDIAMGAQMNLPLYKGAMANYIREVERVATSGLPDKVRAALSRMKSMENTARAVLVGSGIAGAVLPGDMLSKATH
jgi:hypothetical protein